MDDFNHFFDDQREPQPERTPIYHTPEPKNNNKLGATSIICIVLAVVMCIVVLVNVIVLASLKNIIAEEYASQIAQSVREEYKNAIDDSLQGTNIVDDVTNAASQSAIERLTYAVGQVAEEYCSASVARLYLFKNSSYTSLEDCDGVASGFLITDTDANGTKQRYLLTNAHCARYAYTTTSGYGGFGGFGGSTSVKYEWKSYAKIIAVFENPETHQYDTSSSNQYQLEIIAYGAYDDSVEVGSALKTIDGENSAGNNSEPDIALLRIKGKQPSNEAHPSLSIYSKDNDVDRGTPIALIGNPEGIGNSNSITSGTISQAFVTLDSWGDGSFHMTDAAVNSGNSGGPMVNISGYVIGIVESKLADESIDNMGFALSNEAIIDFIEWAEKKSNNLLKTDINVEYSIV